ncbi:MAG: uroporphyrinogen decarboxylase family protein [Promethearchaeota archaeon]
MVKKKSIFFNVLSKNITDIVPLYCTGYPEFEFIRKYIHRYGIKSGEDENLILKNKDYSIIKYMGFDAISVWDFRRGSGGYKLNGKLSVDGWGRIYERNWYLNDGVFKDLNIMQNWKHLTLPSKENLALLNKFLIQIKSKLNLDIILSLPGLFEKTWQSMGFLHFAKSLKNGSNIELIRGIIEFFSNYLEELIKTLHRTGAELFLIADDCGYKTREFIPKETWQDLFLEEYMKIVDLIHNKNNFVIIHSDGYISNLIDVFIDIGFDAIQSLESSAGNDIISLFQKYKNKITFIGNLDMSELMFGTPEQVKKYIEKLIKKARKYNCLFIISPTQQINAKVKPENIKAMIDTTKIF